MDEPSRQALLWSVAEALPEDSRQDAWRALEQRLELEDARERAGKLRGFLNLSPEVQLAPLYRSRLGIVPDGRAATLYLFDYQTTRSGPAGEVAQLTSAALLNVPHPVSSVALKALRRQHKVLERLTASASGSDIVPFDDADFSAQVTVYARDAEAARKLLGPAARDVLKRAFFERGISPTLLIGEQQLLFSVSAPLEEPTPLGVLELLITDLLSLYALFSLGSAPESQPARRQ